MRSRSVPASGAKVMLCLPRVATASAIRTEKLSTRMDGSEIVRLSPNSSRRPSTIGDDLRVVGRAERHQRQLVVAGVPQQLARGATTSSGERSSRGR